jgi:UrcA family protein
MNGRAGYSGPEQGEATMKNPYAIALVSALITAAGIKAAPALAETPSANVETHISYVQTADLDLSNQAGQRTLGLRIAQAAREVCGKPSDADLVGQNKARECRQNVISQTSSERDALLAAAGRGATIVIASR